MNRSQWIRRPLLTCLRVPNASTASWRVYGAALKGAHMPELARATSSGVLESPD